MTDENDPFRDAIQAELLTQQHERCRAWSFGDRIYWTNAAGNERTAYFWHYFPRRKQVLLYAKSAPIVNGQRALGWGRVTKRAANRWFNGKRYWKRTFNLRDVLRVEMSRVSHAQRKRLNYQPHSNHPVHTWKKDGYCNNGENS